MPRLTRWGVRAALLYLLFGFTLGGLLLSAKGGAINLKVWLWLTIHIDALIVGWMLQLAMAIAYWILPRRPLGNQPSSRGRVQIAWAAFGLLNLGLMISLIPNLLRYWFDAWAFSDQAFSLGLTLQVGAFALFLTTAWPRIIPPTKSTITPSWKKEAV